MAREWKEMIRIAKIPHIIEDTDRWGRLLGTFSVVDIQGEIEEEKWEQIKAYESYYLSEKGKTELASAEIQMRSGKTVDRISVPYMQELIGYSKTQIWQFNMCVGTEPTHIRSYAIFGEVTLHEWTSEHDEKVKDLQEQVSRMNSETY